MQSNKKYDLVVIGGGITGAGVFREAVRMGLRTLLVERNDFAWGTSSRSSKLVHGGLRYLKQGKIRLTKISVRERERLVREARGLVSPLEFLMPVYKKRKPGRLILKAGLSIYSALSFKWQHRYDGFESFSRRVPFVRQAGLVGGFGFYDAQVDDARLVLRLLVEAAHAGGCAMNYTAAKEIRRNIGGHVAGVIIADTETDEETAIECDAVINATGAWAETLHASPDPKLHIRPLRGSHLVFPAETIPVRQAICCAHPRDGRPVFTIPWEGAVIFGTTDVDHDADLLKEPAISKAETDYLLEALQDIFPSLGIKLEDCVAATSGVRPVLSKGDRDPSKESREHAIWTDKGLVTVTGGKLTTFRVLATDALNAAKPFFRSAARPAGYQPVFPETEFPKDSRRLSKGAMERLAGRYGNGADAIMEEAAPEDLAPIPGTNTLWAELPFAAKREQIRHLSDLMLRRVRIGILTPRGGKDHIPRIRKLCEPLLTWDATRWETEIRLYSEMWDRCYFPNSDE